MSVLTKKATTMAFSIPANIKFTKLNKHFKNSNGQIQQIYKSASESTFKNLNLEKHSVEYLNANNVELSEFQKLLMNSLDKFNQFLNSHFKLYEKHKSTAVLLTSVLKNKKDDGENPKGLTDKTTTFIKNNCGKLALIGMLPTVIEEGLARINAHKMAKNVLSADNLKKLNRFNAMS